MKNRRKQKRLRRRKILFAVEIIVLLLLSMVLFVAIWAAHKFSLVNHQELDKDRLFTSDQVNGGTAAAGDKADGQQGTTTSSLTGIDVIALVGIDTRAEMDGQNSDTMILACINHNEKSIKLVSLYRDTYLNIGEDYYGNPDSYKKANEAYNLGGPEQFLSMVNLNLDLNVTEYVTVDFSALCTTIELLGGLDIEMTREELIHLNNYNKETAPACNMEYVEIEVPPADEYDGAMLRTFHLNGSQAVSYARIRKTAGNDFRRASRQRVVLSKIMEKAKMADIVTLDAVLNAVLPLVTTNLDNGKIVSMIRPVLKYSMPEENQTGFPFAHVEDDGTITGLDCVLPVTLEYNVRQLHEFLFPGTEYTPSPTVQTYSQQIIYDSGYAEEDIEWALAIDDGAEIPKWSQELQNQADAAAEGY